MFLVPEEGVGRGGGGGGGEGVLGGRGDWGGGGVVLGLNPGIGTLTNKKNNYKRLSKLQKKNS